ncbi:MAG: carbohydrate ABC transporter permease [Hungatella sp.]|jgi:oligogalacturonide transport system permease protein|nr:carbohydrate ABC transporter permease [Hungatella sp.]
MKKRKKHNGAAYFLLIVIGAVITFPFVWMIFACFKTNGEILGSTKLLPSRFSFDAFKKGWNGVGNITFATYFKNTFLLVIPTVVLTVMSCSFVAFGFARFRFPGKKMFFALMISTLMLPNSVIIIPRYLIFNKLGLLNSYWPFYLPALFACFPFFIFMIIQFMRGIPRELDEAAYIDGCSSLGLYVKILLPLMKPALFSAGLFQFMWTWNDFFNTLIYISSVKKFPVSLGLRASLDTAAQVQWDKVMAMSLISILPLIVMFFAAQKYFVEGISTTGLKG